MFSRSQYAAIRHRKAREQAQIAQDHVRAAERAALALGLCPTCGADIVGGEPHTPECESDDEATAPELTPRGSPPPT